MAYEFSQTTIESIISEAYSDAGLSTQEISGLQLDEGKFNLNRIFSSWSTRPIPLYCVRGAMVEIIPGQSSYKLPPNFIDTLEVAPVQIQRQLNGFATSSNGGTASNAFDGNNSTACTQNAINGNISYDYGAGKSQAIKYIGITSNAYSTYNLAIEYSYDNNIWYIAQTTGSVDYIPGQTIWFVNSYFPNVRAWRIRETGGSTLNIEEIYFSTEIFKYVITRISRQIFDSSYNTAQSGVSAYYVNRIVDPILNLWPNPDNSYRYLFYNYKSYVMDVEDYLNFSPLPQRYMDAIIYELAARVAFKYNPSKYDSLKMLAQEAYSQAAAEDIEKVPLTLSITCG
jgi:hypothetical protein